MLVNLPMSKPSQPYARIAPWLCLLGIGLVVAAWPVGLNYSQWAWSRNIALRGVLAMVYALVLFPLLVYGCESRFRFSQRCRHVLVALMFSATLYLTDVDANKYHIARALGTSGFFLLALGLWHWPAALIKLERINRFLSDGCRKPNLLAGFLGLIMIAVTIALGWVCFQFLPAIVDSTAQYVHAKYMAQGELYGIANPFPSSFPLWLVINSNKFFAQYQPAYIALLALGHLIHAPWVINPCCAGITLWATYALAKRIFGESTALCAALFMLGCQFLLFMASEYMNHTSSLCFLTLFMLCFVCACDAVRTDGRAKACWLGAACGLCLGGDILIRPLSALGIGFPFILYGIYLLIKHPRAYAATFSFAAITVAASLCFAGWYNYQLNGDILTFPATAFHRHIFSSAIGFGDEPLTFNRFFERRQIEWSLLNTYLFDWPIPCLSLVMFYVLRPSRTHYARLLVASLVSMAIIGLANQFYSYLFGPRYIFDTLTALIILSAAGFRRLPALLSLLPHAPSRLQLKAGCNAICIILFATGFAFRFPDMLHFYSNHYLDNDPAFYQSMLNQSDPPALIFMGHDGKDISDIDKRTLNYRKVDFTYPPHQTDDRIFAQDLGDKENQGVINFYSGRHVYIESHGFLKLQNAKKPE